MEANGAKEVAKVSFDVSEVSISPDLPEELQLRVHALLVEFQDVFAGEQVSLPKPFAAEPVKLKFISNPEPQSVPEPRWTFAEKQILTAWAEEGLKNGSLELSTSCWASRPHIVMKTPAHTHKDLIDVGKCKLRVCGDYRKVNTQIVKIVPNLPNGLEEVEKAAGHEFFWETDAVACYSQFVLALGQSREALAVVPPRVSSANDASFRSAQQRRTALPRASVIRGDMGITWMTGWDMPIPLTSCSRISHYFSGCVASMQSLWVHPRLGSDLEKLSFLGLG